MVAGHYRLALAGFSILPLLSAAVAARGAADYPRTADVERVMLDFLGCEGDGCPAPPRGAVVRNLRCMPDGGWEYQGRTRMICVFSGRWIGPGYGDAVMDCAYLWRGPSGAWAFQASPDHDLCEGYQAELADAPVIE